MGPKTNPKDKAGKGRGKQDGAAAAAQVSRIDFGLPQSVVASLQAIAARSTQDLWSSPAAVAADLTIEQQHSRQASASYKLSKRIAGNSKAKEDLASALAEWAGTIGLHLVGLVQRVKALGDKIDEDLRAACQEMETTLVDLPSSTTAERIQAASMKLGPVWTAPQASEIVRIASALRAFSVVPGSASSSGDGASSTPGAVLGPPGIGTTPLREAVALLSTPGAPATAMGTLTTPRTTGAVVVPAPTGILGPASNAEVRMDIGDSGLRHRRWKRGNVALPYRPSKSPRREEPIGSGPSGALASPEPASAPWVRGTTGRTPEAVHRPSLTEVADDIELLPDPSSVSIPTTWLGAWQQAAMFCCANGGEHINELTADPEQDAIWPLHLGTDADVASLQAEAEAFWVALPHAAATATEEMSAELVASCQDLLQKLRLCPGALAGVRQGVVVLIQATLGNLLDYRQYGPATAQEWLYPSLLMEHGGSAVQIFPAGSWQGQPIFTTGSVLHCDLASALGMQAHEWEMRRLIERPMGGSIRLLQVRRDRPCIEAIRGCLLDLGQDISRPVLIRTGIGLFLPTASVLLLPEVDAFQVWPGPDVVAPLSDSDSLTQPPSNADRFALSLTMPHVAESSFHEASGSNAVVISDDGLFYVASPSYCDHLTLRSAVLQAFLEDGVGDRRVPLHFARILPPLDGLPSVQFAALRCNAGMSPALVDLRPMGGALQVFGASMYDTPAMRIQAAIARNGDPAARRPLTAQLAAGSVQVMRREVDVNPFVVIQGYLDAEGQDSVDHPHTSEIHPLLMSLQQFSHHVEHYRLSLRLSFPDSLTRLSWIDAAGLPGRVHTMFCFSVASPAETFRFYLQGDRPFFHFKELLQQCSGRLGRGPAVLVSPMPLHRCVQFVAPPRELTHYTVLLDTGNRRYCVDVPHQGRGIRTGDVILAHADEDSKPFEVGPVSIPLGADAVQISFFGQCALAIGCTERALLKSLGKMLQLSLASPSGISLAAVYTVVLLLGRGQRSSLPLLGNAGICYTRALEIELPEPTEACPAWCHELACRHTHFATTADGLRHHLSRLAPFDTFQVAVWTPLGGPTLFEAPKQVTSGQFAYLLAAAGHRAADHRLHLAFDTQATVADVLSIPAGSSIWWIVRDGLARELLRPVAFWYEGHDRIAVTLNSHGQASGLIASPEVARLRALPQGVRTAMHIAPGNANNLAVSGPPVLSMSPTRIALIPQGLRDGSLTLGVPAEGDFVWTTPRIVKGVAHLLHIPSGVAPPTPFWLLHFRGKGAVVAVQAPGFDWTFVSQQAVEAFGGDFFTKGAFGVHHCGRVFPFNTPLPVPPHGAIISLVRMTQPNHAGFSTWDAPPEACWVPQFDYDICMGPLGEPALSLRATDNARHTGRGPVRSPDGDNASLCHHSEMAAQLTQVTSRLQDLTTRLEASGVLAPTTGPASRCDVDSRPVEALHTASTPDPWTSVEHWDGSSPRSRSWGLHSVGSLLLLFQLRPWMFLLASELLGLPVDAAGAVTEDPTGPEAPVEPSSPSYSDLQAPTPDTTIEGEGLASTVRASDSAAASTMVPVDGPTVANVPAFDQGMVPAMQRRVAAHLQGVNVAPQGHPFLPHGCPITIHDPFSRGSTCELLTSSIATGLIFEEMLRDYVARRGWQPLVSVYPQPDALSVHLIPAAADTAQITVRGRRGRIREPYTASRDPNRPIHLRDGDCLHADVGPFGPPPPEPLGYARTVLVDSPSGPCCPEYLSALPVCDAVHLSRTDQRHVTYSLGHYPWRLAPDDQVASHVSHAAGFRATYLCPWLGPQGDFQGPSTLTTAALARRYQGGDSAVAGLMPVWPGDRSDRLLFVPQMTEANPLVCVVARSEHCQRSLLLPPDSAYEQICRAVVYLARFEVGQVRLPPAVFALCGLRPNADIHLRTGDVLDVLAGRQEATCCRPTSVGQLKDSTLWTRPVFLSFPVPVYLWLPSLRQPIVHLLPAGTWWDPVSLSFDGPFRQSFAGRWVPVSWAPSHVVHMTQASDDANIVHVFIESQGQLVAQATDRCQTVARFAAARGLLSTELVVIGVPSMSVDWRLRDGDIVFDNFLSDPQARPWDPLASASPSRTALGAITGACWIVTGSSACFVLVFSSWLPPTGAVRGRSRTPPDSSEDEFDCTVAPVGLWKPELTHPLESFPQRWDYHILCPFRGWSSCIQAPASTTHTDFQHITRRFCGGWVRGHLLLGPSRITGMGVVLPLPSAGLATIFVHAGGSSHAAVVPRHCCLDVLLRHLQRLCWPIGIWLRLPPALTRAQMPRDASLALRDGDTFSLELDMYHPAFRSQPSETVARVDHLNHLNLWHVPFRLRHGGWIFIWHDEENLEHQCERHWVTAHSTWMPRWSQFVPPRGEPLADKIVPVPCLKDGECHFVRRSDFMEARVLMVDPLDASADECRLLSLSRLGCDIPFGWQHRPDIQIRNRDGGLRDGDVLVPTSRVSARSRFADILAALGLAGFRGYSGLSLFLPLLCISLPASSMFAPPQEVQGGDVGNIGMFPWRVPVEHRACHEAVPSEGCARLFSPFEADAPLVPVSPETLVEDLTINLVSCGPAWCTDLMPVWPNIWVPHINFLPAPDDRRLVCVLVVSPEWQLPCDQHALPSTSVGPFFGWPYNEAVDWRNGDLFLAMGPSGSALHDQPSFSHGSAVRTSAVWSYDFFCTCALPVVVWVPGRRPSRTVLPPGSQWRANLAAFEGEFQQRYPGHWAPVPWAYSHDVHLCQRADDEPPHWLWSPYRGRLGPVLCSEEDEVRQWLHYLEPLWFRGHAKVHPSLEPYEHHWVPLLATNSLVTVLVLGAPRPLAVILPSRLTKRLLFKALKGLFPDMTSLVGNHPSLRSAASDGSEIRLRHGDLLATCTSRWQPSLDYHLRQHFSSPLEAQELGLWSHDLDFDGPGMAILHRAGDLFPLAIALEGTQKWDSHACTLRPALQGLLESWWPCTDTASSITNCIHFRAFSAPLESEAPAVMRSIDAEPPADRIGDPHPPDLHHVPMPFSHGLRSSSIGRALVVAGMFLSTGGLRGDTAAIRNLGPTHWSLVWLGVYLAAFGAPRWEKSVDCWQADLSDVCHLQAAMHETWWTRSQRLALPSPLPPAYHASWQLSPAWNGGVPDSLLIATDGSGAGSGSWAFAVWGLFAGIWHRIDWEAGTLPQANWMPEGVSGGGADTRSYRGELAALQAAAMWCLANLDLWSMHMGSMPRLLTIAVDNSSAMQVAAGHAATDQLGAAETRAVWQAVQARISTSFQHVHSHTGVFVNTIVDALATWVLHAKAHPSLASSRWAHWFSPLSPWLWLVAKAKVVDGRPTYRMPIGLGQWCPPALPEEARSRPGRWSVAGWHTWRSGAEKGQYGCEIWVNPRLVTPALQLSDWRILLSTPRILVITCLSSLLPVTICSAHAPHADRPDREATEFWALLTQTLQEAPRYRVLLIGLDANGDFCSADEDDHLIGTLVSQAEPARNDDCLLEMCLRLGLVAPATFPDTQLGEGWSWQHTSSKRKRLDHLLFQAGPWEIARTSQALAFDIVNVQRDHMALWAQATLHAAAPQGRRDAPRRCLPSEVIQGGQAIWKDVRLDGLSCTGELVQSLLDGYGAWRKALPSRPPLTPKQPYIQATTLGHLNRLRDWRAQVRHVKSEGARLLLHLCFQGWKQQGFPDRHAHLQWHQHRLLEAAMLSQEYHLSRRAHNSAKRDKAWYFLQLTHQATDLWHRHGCAMESIVKLRWASRRAAERRAVHAAGGYNIDAALEEQFREQEGGRFVTAQQLRLTQLAWDASPANPCPAAVPTLLQMESACRRQQGSKAPGPDLVLNELWRHYPVQAGQWFWLICTQTALTGREPPHFKLALICALYKKGPAALPQNYRSIALMSGMAKVYHGFLRRGVGHRGLQLGGRPGVPVSFAVAAFRSAWALSVEAHRSCAILYVDIRAAYYEASRDLIFQGGELGLQPDEGRLWHLASLVTCLRCDGALHLLGVPADEIALLQDCVACAHWQLVGSDRYVLATRGSRPGDGLADVLFGALFAIALRHIDDTCCAEGLACHSASTASGAEATPVSIGWADDLAIITDYASPRELQQAFPRVAEIVLDTLHALRFKVNLGLGKTEALLDIRGPEAKAVRGELFGHGGPWQLPNGAELRVTPEYRYLGVVQQVRDTGRRDTELSAQRGRTAWMHGRNLLSSESVPWALKQAWVAGRILPAAYATLATCIAVSERATAPLEGLFERLARTVVGSWRFGHVLHRASLLCLLGLSSPAQAVLIARARLTVQLVHKAPQPVWRLFDTAWNHAVPWCELLADACRAVARGVPGRCGRFVTTSLAFVRDNQRGLLNACRFLSRWGTLHSAFHDLWHDLDGPRMRKVLGPSVQAICPLCRAALPSAQALAAHVHRKHSVVNWLTRYTHGTACFWCHHEMHSTDRLKYHLRTNPSCVHGLRVTVGEVYEYGTGTRRGGPRGHRGVPAIRLPQPLNATPAQRRAAEAGRACSAAELATELRQVVGAAHVYDWPPLPEPPVQLADQRLQAPHVEQPPVPPISQPSGVISSASGSAAPQSLRWRCVHDYDEKPTNWAVPSMLWSAKDVGHTVWQLPQTWHRYWNCWKAASSLHPWDEAAKGPLRALRGAASHHTPCARDPPLPLLCLLAATVSFRHICARVRLGGALWLWGLPSATGTAVLRALLPSAVFSRLCLSGRTVFVAHHPCCPRVWQPALAALCAPVPGGPSPAVLPVRASLIFRSESLGRS
ncbi:unnamed protein product [Symbiodinium sp. CCMP2592]|nr:unnamed protein product [Symbiodinium sp. CCMP2592]